MKIDTTLPLRKFNWNSEEGVEEKCMSATAKCNCKDFEDISSFVFAIDLQIQFEPYLTGALISRENIIRIDNVRATCGHKGCCYYFPSGEHRSDVSFNLIAHFQSTKLYPTRRSGRAQFSRSTVFSDQRFPRPFFPMLYCESPFSICTICLSAFDDRFIISIIISRSERIIKVPLKFRLDGDVKISLIQPQRNVIITIVIRWIVWKQSR